MEIINSDLTDLQFEKLVALTVELGHKVSDTTVKLALVGNGWNYDRAKKRLDSLFSSSSDSTAYYKNYVLRSKSTLEKNLAELDELD